MSDAVPDDWTARQGHILTGGGLASKCYVEGRDYKSPDDLPHTHKIAGTAFPVFLQWRRQGKSNPLIVGAWSRPLFSGGWTEDSDKETAVVNIQTPSLFIDFRVPYSRPAAFARRSGFDSLSMAELRVLARQHCFAGFSLVSGSPPVCVRHHAIDWNPSPRRLPNKWRIQLKADGSTFKEYCFANDEHGQAVYMERWQRLDNGPYLALWRTPSTTSSSSSNTTSSNSTSSSSSSPYEMLLVVGNRFTYIRDRPKPLPSFAHADQTPSLANLADAAPDRETLVALLDLECSTGTIFADVSSSSSTATAAAAAPRSNFPSWRITMSTLPWRQGRSLLTPGDVRLEKDADAPKLGAVTTPSAAAARPATVRIWGEPWTVFENSFTASELARIFGHSAASRL
eukprot:m.60791 g.60791  ORF g.60791 m.60791 type:complete len:398 (+) comp13682_c0_seq1:96-1289(+)